MKMTTRGRYGLRAILELTRRYGGPPVLMSVLAEKEGLSRKYLHSILASLKAAGIILAVRGAGGGFQLSRPPDEIRLNEVLAAVEGPLSLVDCVSDAARCGRSGDCTARQVWQRLSRSIDEVLGAVTLAELISSESHSGGGG